MKFSVWQGFKLAAWLITSFLISLMVVVYVIDYSDSAIDIIFYFNKIFLIIIMWILLYIFKYIFNRISEKNNNENNK
tara:strand:- start:4752 stop:4982 length:231 start_codon:yes stop_codon:yes gene_type:complete